MKKGGYKAPSFGNPSVGQATHIEAIEISIHDFVEKMSTMEKEIDSPNLQRQINGIILVYS